MYGALFWSPAICAPRRVTARPCASRMKPPETLQAVEVFVAAGVLLHDPSASTTNTELAAALALGLLDFTTGVSRR